MKLEMSIVQNEEKRILELIPPWFVLVRLKNLKKDLRNVQLNGA